MLVEVRAPETDVGPVVQAGATTFKTSANQAHRAVPDAQPLYAAADALAEAVQEDREGVSAWLRNCYWARTRRRAPRGL